MSHSLVLVEHDGSSVRRSSLGAIALARQLGPSFSLLIIGQPSPAVAASVARFGADRILVADHPSLAEPAADTYSRIVAKTAQNCGALFTLATSSTFAKDVLPRAAALLDAPMLSDVCAVRNEAGQLTFERPVAAGSSYASVRIDSPHCVISARSTAYPPPAPESSESPVESINLTPDLLRSSVRFISREKSTSSRPDLGDARIVVCGGRPLKDRATFENLIGGLADTLQGAIGATRAAVDAGMAPNEWQVGQTGTTVAPEVYFGIGVSGAIQHMAGIQDSRIIIAINRDPDAPMIQSATYTLVGDLFEIVPKLITAFRQKP